MSKRSSTSLEIKLQVVQRCIEHNSNSTYESKQLGVSSHKKRSHYVKSNAFPIAENVMNREFTESAPNMKWCTDVTELKCGQGQKSYLSAIIDVYDYSIVSWVLGHANNNKLVMDTINKAYEKNPGAKPLLHSDRGFQYTSHDYNSLQKKINLW